MVEWPFLKSKISQGPKVQEQIRVQQGCPAESCKKMGERTNRSGPTIYKMARPKGSYRSNARSANKPQF